VADGQLVCAFEEERFTRIKHCAGFPAEALKACLEMAGVSASDIDHFAVSRSPRAHAARKARYALSRRPGLGVIRNRVRNATRVRDLPSTIAATLDLDSALVARHIHYVEHHPAHLASAFFVSPFDEAAVCAIDGFGDFVSTSIAVGRGASLKILDRTYFPHSLGLVYLAITQYLGFLKFGDEYKVMGLAPYGKPAYTNQLRQLIRLKRNGRFELELDYFRHWNEGTPMTWDNGEPVLGPAYSSRLEELLGPSRTPGEPLEQRHEDIAASLQVVYEEAAFHILDGLYDRLRLPRLCMAGGCAMNSVANGKIRERTPFHEVYVQPASADNGTALGAAFYVWNQILSQPRGFHMRHSYWGTETDDQDIGRSLGQINDEIESRCTVTRYYDENELCRSTAERITRGEVVGWFQGRMEWGARALGNRSILADPRRHNMREIINTRIKFREKFRPFAPSVLEEALEDYFIGAVADPFMIQVYPVRPDKRELIPAVTHVDGSGRLQTVSRRDNPMYWKLIKAFEGLTGVPILLNTSFNENEPIVRTPAEALDCFLRTKMDALVIGNVLIAKQASAEVGVETELAGAGLPAHFPGLPINSA